jgi:hypothetical protein
VMPRRFFVLLCVGVLAFSIMRVDEPIIKTYPAREVTVREVEYRERVVEVPVPVRKPDGYMSEDQCMQLAKGTDFRDLIWQYGWPAGEDADDSYAGFLTYPLREDHSRYCTIDIWDSEIDRKTVDLP